MERERKEKARTAHRVVDEIKRIATNTEEENDLGMEKMK